MPKILKSNIHKIKIDSKTADALKDISQTFLLDQKTIYTMAILHGIKNIHFGYMITERSFPTPDKILEIDIDKTIWNDFEMCAKNSKIIGWKMFKVFLDMELQPFIEKKNAIIKANPCENNFTPCVVQYDTELLPNLYDDLEVLYNVLDFKRPQLAKYLLISAWISEENTYGIEAMKTDMEILELIKANNLDKENVFKFLEHFTISRYRR